MHNLNSTQTSHENSQTGEESFFEREKCHELKSQSPSLETAITIEPPTIAELQKSTVITPGEGKKLYL